MIKWFKELFRIVREYDGTISALEVSANDATYRISDINKFLTGNTSINVDVAPHHMDTHNIIMIGEYGNRDYIQTFNMSGDSFERLLKVVRDLSQYGHIDRVDIVPAMREIFEQETNTTLRRNTRGYKNY